LNVQRITNLPNGGGANSGRDVWFAIETEDGVRQELQIYLHQLDTFILGLRRFGASAEDLLEQNYPGSSVALEKYSPTPVKFKARKGEDGAISLALLDELDTPIRVNLPASSIKPLLMELLKAIAAK
jgi:hypothetical protein